MGIKRVLSVYKWATMGGVERVLLNRAHAIQEADLNIQYDVFFFHDSGGKEKFREYITNNGLDSIVNVVEVINQDYDVIFSIDTPEILDIVDASKTFIECHTSYEKNRTYLKTLPSNIRGILVPSEHFKQSIISEVNLDLKSKVRVLSNNVYTQSNSTQHSKIYMKTPILYVGRIDRLKNVEDILKIFVQYNEIHGDQLILILAGNVIEHEIDLETLLMKYGIQDRTIYLPPLNFDKVWDLLKFVKSQRGVFMSASLHESFGLSVAEAMAFEIPVLLFNNVAHSNLVKHNDEFLFDRNSKEKTVGKLFNIIENYEVSSGIVEKYSLMLQDEFMIEFKKNNFIRGIFLNPPKMLYLMHVHWNWIKQRPHFLFEEMTKHYSVDLYYVNRVFHKNKINNERKGYNEYTVNELYKLPYSSRSNGIRFLEKSINSRSFSGIKEYNYIWITSPVIMQLIPDGFLDNKIVIYDCMDNFMAFDINKENYHVNIKYEIDLIMKSSVVLVSSNFLKQVLINSYGQYLRSEPIVINNGISNIFINQNIMNLPDTHDHSFLNIMYIGTVARWVDINLIMRLLDRFANIIITLVGPIELNIPTHERLVVIGPVEHHLLPEYAKKADAFIMPFILNDLILSVNPVKIYEYLSFYKPVISIKYDEMNQFENFIHLYSTDEELFGIINNIESQIIDEKKRIEIRRFLEMNTWEKRSQIIKGIFDSI